MEEMAKARELAQAWGAYDVRKSPYKWNGCNAYLNVWGNLKAPLIGLPILILAKDGDVWISSQEDTLAFIDAHRV